ncbi:MAG TPA: cell division protein FtsZ [Anaerolineaceae bacterium]|nr:cell division protein FtsZ [Anaerolineaceae bacterium]HQF44306.1 cell division protein FtsZ [Anaerolineaceae bacterium]HQP59708.1 cell division protein FtsZ [Anaerolineaceae bacterium]
MNIQIATSSHIKPITPPRPPVLKAIGLGGGGSNAINRMIELGLSGVEFIAANTDGQALAGSLAPKKILLGPHTTRGLGAGGDPSAGYKAAEESFKTLCDALAGADLVFLTAGMGGGTGTGSIAMAAKAAKTVGAVTVAIVTMPFAFEVGKRQRNAREGLATLRPYTDTLIAIPNERLLDLGKRDLTLDMAFRLADDILRQGIQGITELITETGLINVDFAHVRQVMQNGGGSLLAIGFGEGEGKAIQAIDRALHHPLLDTINLENATGILANFTAGPDITFMEVVEALNELQARANFQAEIIPGVTTTEEMENRAQVILVITGLGGTPVQNTFNLQAGNPVPVENTVVPAMQDKSAQEVTQSIPELEEVGASSPYGNLDLPAFMRRRLRRQ